MSDPVTAGCFVRAFQRMGLCPSDSGGDPSSITIQPSNSCNRWLCCTGSQCCSSTTIIGQDRVVASSVRRRGGLLLTKRNIRCLIATEDCNSSGEGDTEDNKRTNRYVFDLLKAQYDLFDAALIAAIRDLPDQKFKSWSPDADITLTVDDISSMKKVAAAEKVKVDNLKPALAQKKLLDEKQKNVSTNVSETEERKRGRKRGFSAPKTFVVPTEEHEELSQPKKFNINLLMNDILALVDITKEEALSYAKKIKKKFENESQKKVSRKDIREYLRDLIFIYDLPIRDTKCKNYDQDDLSAVSKKVDRVAQMSLADYLLLTRSQKSNPSTSSHRSIDSTSIAQRQISDTDLIVDAVHLDEKGQVISEEEHNESKFSSTDV